MKVPRRSLIALVGIVIVLGSATVATGWVLSAKITEVRRVVELYPLRVLASGAPAGTVTLSWGPDAAEPGTFRLSWAMGWAQVGPVLQASPNGVVRPLRSVHGQLQTGQHVGVQSNPLTGDPQRALGLAFRDAQVPSALGPMPAWQIDGRRRTWVILVHGLGGSRADTLPAVAVLHAAGFPLLAVSYRNDVGAPASPDRRSHLGQTEWRDVADAVRFALEQGATGVVLYGWSLGGGMAGIIAAQPTLRAFVRALVLDSPMLDWHSTLVAATQRQGLPAVLVPLTEQALRIKVGLDLRAFSVAGQATALRVPALVFQGTADTVVPPAVADEFARERPDLVTLVRVAGADHVSAVDVDKTMYDNALTTFLSACP